MGLAWNLPETLERHEIKVSHLLRVLRSRGTPMSKTTVYRWAKEPPEKATLPHLKNVIEALREITGEDIRLEHLLEYIPDET